MKTHLRYTAFILAGLLGGVALVRSQQTQRIPQFENDDVKVWKSVVMPDAPLQMHRHDHGRVIIALQGGTMNIVEKGGATEPNVWRAGNAYWLPANAPGTMHADVNAGAKPIEVMVVELKKDTRPGSNAQNGEAKDAVAAVQKVFDGMAAHDAAMIRSVMLPDARLASVRDERAPSGTSSDDFATRIAAIKGDVLERFTSPPTVLIHGRMAQVWGDYEFLFNGKFTHCGVDSFSLLKSAEGWKVAEIVDTQEAAGCAGH